jgi:hypothetical protein
LDAISYRKLAGFQPYHGLYPLLNLVLWKNLLPDLFDHVVQVDIPQVKGGPVAEPGVEIFIAYKPVQFITGNSDRHFWMAFLRK